MKLILRVYDSLCTTETFEINGIKAIAEDFGENHDHDSENADELECNDMRFTGKESTPAILAKYSINKTEYDIIVYRLEEKLSFGQCCYCT